MTPARLHLVTSDAVLEAPGFPDRAAAVLEACGPAAALHVRGHGMGGRVLCDVAGALLAVPGRGPLLVNDRVDVALGIGADGVQLGRRSLPVRQARRLLGARAVLGYSAHAAGEAAGAADEGADFVVLGAVYPTPSHPGEPGAGTALLEAARAVTACPIVAIGGITPERVAAVTAAGARGVAVLSGVWDADDAVAAAGRYLAALAAAEGKDG